MVVSAYAVTVAIIPIVVTSTRAIEEKEEGVIHSMKVRLLNDTAYYVFF